MSDDQLAQGTVDFRLEERRAANRGDFTPARARTPKDDIWDTLTASFGDPRTKTERAMFGRVVAELLETGATAEETDIACRYVLRAFDHPSVNAVPKWFTASQQKHSRKVSDTELALERLRKGTQP